MFAFKAFVAAAAALTTVSVAHAETVWNFATPYNDQNFHTRNIAAFAADVEEMTGGKLKLTLHTNASLLKMGEIKRGVQTGQVQLGEILLSAYGSEDPFFEVDGIPFLSQGQMTAWRVYELTLPRITEILAEDGLMPLFSVPWPGQGIYAQNPVSSVSDFEGVKFRAYNAVTARFAELMGAVPTTVQSAEVPQAFATGVVSAMITSAATGNDTKAWDFATHFYDVNAMNNKNMVLMHKRAFDALEPDVRDALLAAAAKAETRGWVMSGGLQAELTANLIANGMIVEPPSEAFLAGMQAIGDQLVQEWLEKAGEAGQAFIDAYNAL